MASFTGMPKETSIGIRILAPPRPVRAPRKPTGIEMRRRDSMPIAFDHTSEKG